MLFHLVCGAFCVAAATAGLFNFNNQLGLTIFNPNNNNNNNNRIRDTFMSGVLRGKNSVCNGTGALAASSGECKPQKECRKQGGTPSGTCALVGSCCITENTCGNTTRAKISYFSNPATLQPTCGLTIAPYSPNVCQLRLDFERFDIEGPAIPPASPACNVDSFTVMGSTSGNLGFQALCGENSGQHIYIPINNTIVTLQFSLAGIRTGLGVTNPSWRIKITQLECTTTIQDYSSLQSALTSLYQKHQTKKSNSRNDRDLIAPDGCLQYFPQPTGTYRSFNYNNGLGPTIANLNYAICFNRGPSICGIRHTIRQFNLDSLNPPECRRLLPGETDDWLLIPGAVANGAPQDYYCSIQPTGTEITSYQSGPLYVQVRSDELGLITGPNDGFEIDYNTLGNCPQITVG